MVLAGALTVAFDGDGSGHGNVLAGSGDAPANTTYVQPSTAAMTMGATATITHTCVGACDDRSGATRQGERLMWCVRSVLGVSATAAAGAALALAGSGVAVAGSSPDVTGQKYSDAQSAISGAGLTPVVKIDRRRPVGMA